MQHVRSRGVGGGWEACAPGQQEAWESGWAPQPGQVALSPPSGETLPAFPCVSQLLASVLSSCSLAHTALATSL